MNRKGEHKMKPYRNPELFLITVCKEDVIATSYGIHTNMGAAPDPTKVIDSLDF